MCKFMFIIIQFYKIKNSLSLIKNLHYLHTYDPIFLYKNLQEDIRLIEEQARKEEEALQKRVADHAFISINGPTLEKEKEDKRIAQEELRRDEENKVILQRRLEEKRELENILSFERDKMVLALMRQDYGDEVLCILVIWQAPLLPIIYL